MYREFKSPFSVQLELTTKCNHNCIHCYNHWRKEDLEDKTLNLNEIKAIIKNLKNSEVPSLLITGGEPMLYPDLMIKAFSLCKNEGIKGSLNSNLTLVTDKIAQDLKRLKVNVLTSMLSFDYKFHDEITLSPGSFEKLINGIKILQKYDVGIGVNMVVMQKNINQIYETGKFVHSLGIDTFRATKVHPAQGSLVFEEIKLPPEKIHFIFDELIRLQKDFNLKVDSLTTYPICLLKNLELYGKFILKRSCSAGKTGCTIGADGQVRPCGHSDDNYGNAITESILKIWPRLRTWRDGSLLPKECKECNFLAQCSGGCRMDCKFYGDINSMDQYATSKDFCLIPQKTKEEKLLDLDIKLTVNPKLKFRQEKFGAVLLIDHSVITVVTKDTSLLLEKLKGKEFSINDICNKYKLDINNTCIFVSNLFGKNIINYLV